MKLYARNTLSGLVPLWPSDYDQKRKLKIGEDYEVTIKRPRNIQFHRKFFALINVGHQNTKLEMPVDEYRKYVTIKAGYYNSYVTPKGAFITAQSINFGSMDEDTFSELYDRVIDVIIKDIGATQQQIEEEIINFM